MAPSLTPDAGWRRLDCLQGTAWHAVCQLLGLRSGQKCFSSTE